MLNIIGVVTLVVRYKAQAGRLLQVVRRDGSIYYLTVLGSFSIFSVPTYYSFFADTAVRLAFAIIHSYASLPVSSSPLDIYRTRADGKR